ncbi:MAG: YbhB/YbcL family Raf kinase inhibitor-like protein [Acidimicrobiia bacterium]
MELVSNSFADGERADDRLVFAAPDPDERTHLSSNRNPHLSWSDVPEGTKSFVVTCIDPDCPSSGEDVNQEGREVSADLPRIDFVHWLLADVPADITEIAEGSHSSQVTPRGKGPDAPVGIHGVNSYTDWTKGDPDLSGVWHGYDGPAPPWNDAIPHRYIFTVSALDIESLGLSPGFTRDELLGVMDGHVLEEASLTTVYSTNPSAS